ncbi:thiamine pyrophosphate-binding protein [Rhodococcus koreensis]|uniref:thiamine pyrophosphate-binding protein n=1 Tax=Rhodococcus koreensis TaxID=99653 RepID=UPI00366E2928
MAEFPNTKYLPTPSHKSRRQKARGCSITTCNDRGAVGNPPTDRHNVVSRRSERKGQPMQVYKALAQGLIDHGVETMFGLMGDGNLYLANHYASIPGATYIASAHEAGAVLMANGYASVSGEVGVATVTHGPGLANALPPVIDSVRSRMPIVLICGDTAEGDRNTLQDIAQRDLVLPTGAGFEQVRRPETAVQDLRKALWRATAERRPIVLNVPVDYMWKEVEYQHDPLPTADRITTLDPDAMDRAVGIVAAAERPIVLAGRGAATPSARAAICRLAERLGAPVATTLRGKSLFAADPGALGVFGTLSTSAALDQIGKSDCVIAFGASLNSWTTDSGALLDGKRVVQCDTDPQAIRRSGDTSMSMLLRWATLRRSRTRSSGISTRQKSLPAGFGMTGSRSQLIARTTRSHRLPLLSWAVSHSVRPCEQSTD